MDIRSLISRLDSIESINKVQEAADPAEYARAQQQMARLEKAAQYTGDDEIVRGRMGLPPKLPPIEQWDGKMPQPTGKPDWFARLGSLGGATDAQAQAVAANTADDERTARSRATIDNLVAQATPLLDKLEKKFTAAKESYTSGIARALAESIGYNLEGVEEATEAGDDADAKQLADIMMQLADIDDPKVKALQDRYAKLLDAMSAAKSKPQAATPAPSNDPGTIDPAKLRRFKELLAKAKTGAGQSATPTAKSAEDPLKKDTATAGALPNPAGPVAKENMSESEIIAKLRQQLEAIDSKKDQEVDEIAGALRGIANVGRNFISGLKGGGTVQQMGKAGQFGKVATGGKAAQKVGAAIRANPGKTALGTAAAGAGLGYTLSDKGDGGQSVTPAPTPTPTKPETPSKPAAPTAPTAPTAGAIGSLSKAESDELLALEKELGIHMGRVPELDQALLDFEALTKK